MNKLPDYDRAWVPADSSIEPFCEAWCGRTEPEDEGGFPIHDSEWQFQCLQRDIALANSDSPSLSLHATNIKSSLSTVTQASRLEDFTPLDQTELDSLAN